MQIKSIFIMSLVMALSFVGCTSDMDESVNSQEKRMEEIRSKILSISEEYGVRNNLIVTDEVVKKHLNDTEDDIADWMKSIAMVKGSFVGIKKGDDFIFRKINRTTRIGGENESWSASFNDRAGKDDYTLYFSLSASYSDEENNNVEISNLVLSYPYYVNGTYMGRKEDDKIDHSNESSVFAGSNYGFDFSCTISSSKLDCSWTLICNYSGKSLGCSLI